jgi:hypothetical protein
MNLTLTITKNNKSDDVQMNMMKNDINKYNAIRQAFNLLQTLYMYMLCKASFSVSLNPTLFTLLEVWVGGKGRMGGE